MHDTRGIQNLHGIPGLMGGFIGAISASQAGKVFTDADTLNIIFPALSKGRTFSVQAGMQMAALAVTLCLALLSGAFTGFVASRLGRPIEHIFDDEENWHECCYDIELREEEVDDAEPSASDHQNEDD